MDVQVVNTLNITTILTFIALFGTIAGAVVAVGFKIFRQILKEIYDLRTWQIEYQSRTDRALATQTERLEACIHQIPGHPENPANQPAELPSEPSSNNPESSHNN